MSTLVGRSAGYMNSSLETFEERSSVRRGVLERSGDRDRIAIRDRSGGRR